MSEKDKLQAILRPDDHRLKQKKIKCAGGVTGICFALGAVLMALSGGWSLFEIITVAIISGVLGLLFLGVYWVFEPPTIEKG